MSAQDLFAKGQLAEAIEAALNAVRNKPSDLNTRFFLAELLCFDGAWERADKQLDALLQQAKEPHMFALLFRQLIRAEVIREQVFRDGRAPEVMVDLDEHAQLQLRLGLALRTQNLAEVKSLAEQAESIRPQFSGSVNGNAFAGGIRDLDDRISGVYEILTSNGKYLWIPTNAVKSLEFDKPERPFDLIWRKATIDVIGGPGGEVYVPVRYPLVNTEQWDAATKLGRGTSWVGDEESAICGIGQRVLLVGEDALSLMEINGLSKSEV
jgi:type VI secretion system protein ImpE